jgi:hypothetical protein
VDGTDGVQRKSGAEMVKNGAVMVKNGAVFAN